MEVLELAVHLVQVVHQVVQEVRVQAVVVEVQGQQVQEEHQEVLVQVVRLVPQVQVEVQVVVD